MGPSTYLLGVREKRVHAGRRLLRTAPTATTSTRYYLRAVGKKRKCETRGRCQCGREPGICGGDGTVHEGSGRSEGESGSGSGSGSGGEEDQSGVLRVEDSGRTQDAQDAGAGEKLAVTRKPKQADISYYLGPGTQASDTSKRQCRGRLGECGESRVSRIAPKALPQKLAGGVNPVVGRVGGRGPPGEDKTRDRGSQARVFCRRGKSRFRGVPPAAVGW